MMSNEIEPETPAYLPTELSKTKDRSLLIRWSDGLEQTVSFRKLRDNCQCAHCLEKRMEGQSENAVGEKKLTNQLPVLSMAETMPLDIVKMHPIGNYAYSIHFSDGHSAGIFTFELLRSMG